MNYNPKEIEKKWQKTWESKKSFKAVDFDEKEKFYSLVEFPYPSGAGLHVGHVRAYTSLEVISRKKRMEGYNVMFPIGFDAFGLPTENYAIKTGRHPREITDENIGVFTNQLKRIGYSFDWDRVVDTTDPEYYKWTQWIFLKLFENDLAYKDKTFVNFCPDCKVVLANEECQGGQCDRCGSDVVQKEKDVWFLKITKYADKLLDGLDYLESSDRIKTEQRNWIGKSIGAEVEFPIKDYDDTLKIYTTRPDTLYGVTFMVIAPEHPILNTLESSINNMDEVKNYQAESKKKSEFERVQLVKDKTGVELKGVKAINPVSLEEVPIFIADYVMMGYGTGAIMAVPGHDQRDWEFARKYNIPIIEVIKGGNVEEEAYTDTEEGILVNSGIINDLNVKEAKEKILKYLEEKNIGHKATQFKMKDWAFNRQRYWGEPIPIIQCDCSPKGVPVPYEDLPVKLPQVDQYQPTDTGESPLAGIEEWINVTCPKCGKKAKRETDTMPQWAGSSWYYMRYIDSNNNKEFADVKKLNYWLDVDWYNGGMEHVTRHLIYSRFWHRFLYDIGVVPTKEPYKKRTAQGLILGPDGEKMSKSRGNVINPNDIIDTFGADTLRTYIMFIGEYDQAVPWNDNGVKGCRRFLDKVWRLNDKVNDNEGHTKELEVLINQTIKKVNNDYESLKFNTAISSMMTLTNEYLNKDSITKKDLEVLLKLLNPVSPHITEEMWELQGNENLLVNSGWPKYDKNKLVSDEIQVVVQVNGKLRDRLLVSANISKDELEKVALGSDKVTQFIEGKTIRKVIVVPKKLVNIVAN